MRNRAFLKVVLLGLLTLAFVPGLAGAASQGQDLTGMLASSDAERATAVSGAVINVTAASHDFGRVNVGGSSPNFDFTIQNNGDAMLRISAVNHSSPTLGFSASAAADSVPAHSSAVLHTAYSPTSGSGGQSDNVTLVSNADNGSFSVLLHGIANNAPTFAPAPNPSYDAFAFVRFTVLISGHDSEGDLMSWSATGLPVGAVLGKTSDTDSTGTSTATFDWTPKASDGGVYTITVHVSDGLATTNASFNLTVHADNRPPVANPGGPYGGVTGEPVDFNGTGSSDPDAGQTLSFSW